MTANTDVVILSAARTPQGKITGNLARLRAVDLGAIAVRTALERIGSGGAGTSQPMPAATAAWRAGICPAPAVSTWPMITYSTADAGTPAFSRAPAMAMPPRSLPEKSFSDPISLPTGVRAPAMITDVVIPTSKGLCGGRSHPSVRRNLSRQVTVTL